MLHSPKATTDCSHPPRLRILIVEDDPHLRELLADLFREHHFHVETAGRASEMERILDRGTVDLIVLDVVLPGEGGLSICQRIARPSAPAVIMISGLGSEIDRIVGLELGADDYLSKPFNFSELLARVRAVLRPRKAQVELEDADEWAYQFSGWRLDLIGRKLQSPTGDLLRFAAADFSLLQAFIERPRRALSRRMLLDLSRGVRCEAHERAIDVQISRIREKLTAAEPMQNLIVTVRGWGYIFNADVDIGAPLNGLERAGTH